MSFSTETKNELTRIVSQNESNNIAELAGIIRLSGSMQIAGYKKLNLKVTTELNAIARKVFKLLKQHFGINTTISVNKNQMLKRNSSYVLMITSEIGAENLLKTLGILEKKEGFYPLNKVPYDLLVDSEDVKAYIRGAFLGGGSISDPGKTYHIEFVANNEEYAEELRDLINGLGFNSKVVARKNNYVVYLKESEQISDLLSIIGAHSALLSLQNTKVVKAMRNSVNRIVNCETANLSKTVNAAVRQMENINYIEEHMGIRNLPENLQQVALARIEYEDMTLKELGEMINPPISKSGVNHRLRKIEEIAESLRNRREKD